MNNKYRFSPSTLDKFFRVISAEADFESDRNYSEEDGYKLSAEEMRAEREQELLDAINKVPQEPIEAAARGTAFNELVDAIIRATNSGSSVLTSTNASVEFLNVSPYSAQCKCDGFEFEFDYTLANMVALRLLEGTMQLHVQAHLDVEGDDVILHGYPDYIMPNGVVDLKTTGTYEFGKYANYWQRYAYPYILQATGLLSRCDGFEFLVVEFRKLRKGETVQTGTIYEEDYTNVSLEECERQLRWICRGFILWLEEHREQITNSKIFAIND